MENIIKKMFLTAGLLALVLAPALALGITVKSGDSYYLEPGAVIEDNLYIAGGNVSVAGTVNGDLFAVGGNLTLSGPVAGDLASAGGSLNISGRVEGDMRVAGGNISILNFIGGELLVAGGQVSVMQGSVVNKDAKVAGGSINFSGEVKQGMTIKGDTVYVNGKIGGDLSVEASEVKVGPNTVIEGNFEYYSPKQAVFAEGAQVQGETNFHKVEAINKEINKKGAFLGFFGFFATVKSLMILVAALVLMYALKTQSKSIVGQSVASFWKETLRGFIILVVAPVAIILSFVSVVGVYLGVIAALLYVALLIVSSAVAALIFAKLSAKYLFRKPDYELSWWSVVLSVLVLAIITIIPFVGWIFTFILFLSAFGSVSDYFYKKIKG